MNMLAEIPKRCGVAETAIDLAIRDLTRALERTDWSLVTDALAALLAARDIRSEIIHADETH